MRVGWPVIMLALAVLACNIRQAPPPSPSPAPPPTFCRRFADIPLRPRPADAAAYQVAIADFLSDGGSPEALENMLRRWGVIDDQNGLVNADHDFDNDGFLDVVVALRHPPTGEAPQPPGQLLVFGCRNTDARYEILYGLASASDSATGMPQIGYLGDVTNDRLPEVFFYTERCTRLACFQEPYILSWHAGEGRFQPLGEFEPAHPYLDDDGQPIPGFPFAQFRFEGLTGNGPAEFVVQEGHISQREAGPHRPARYIWTWRGAEYAHPIVEYDPSSYRIHALRDADRLLRVGDLDEAIRAYTEALLDRSLIPWGGPYPDPASYALEERMLDAYTRYRLVLAHAAAGDGEAQPVFEIMQLLAPWPSDNPASPYTYLAQVFLQTLRNAEGDDPLGQACAQVKRVAAAPSFTPTYEFLGDPVYFGPTLGDYTVDDLCPY